ncbi:MAG: carboxylesterase family protein, partial [Saprospiraceae bacterium]|nr:carboxylesterase family protein [Saprospiraceae bacterium]
MKHLNTLLIIICALACLNLSAQERYLSEVFSQVEVERNVPYASNITVLTLPVTGQPSLEELTMDVYQPAGDSLTDRPVVIYFHTGSFLPQYINGQITGSRNDSTVVEVCSRLAKMGYVAIAASYRQGWNPIATNQDERTSTLLNAAYRGIQDARALNRFLRKTIAEQDNPFGIDGDKICLWGQGTGGYISLGAAFLDRFDEVVLEKFIGEDATLYVDTNLVGDPYGLKPAAINIPNHVGYSSDFALAVNMGGALGDLSWLEGRDDEPVTIGFHVVRDPFAPFANGAVIVPTTGDFVVNVDGTRTVVGKANQLGVNASVDAANQDLTDVLNQIVNAYKNISIDFGGGQVLSLGEDNMYPFLTDNLESGPWDWWSKAQLDVIIPAFNAATGENLNADTLHANGLFLNPDMSREKAVAHIDTIINYFAPRAFLAMNLM